MFGASANEHRERMPNHLLQWTAIQWARSQGCWYYNFRGIPDTLAEGEELWGVYVFKRGFLDGRAGLMVAISTAESTYHKYFKLMLLSEADAAKNNAR